MESMPVLKGKINLLLKLEDQDTKNQTTVQLNLFNDESEKDIYKRMCASVYEALLKLGVISGKSQEQHEEREAGTTYSRPAAGALIPCQITFQNPTGAHFFFSTFRQIQEYGKGTSGDHRGDRVEEI